MENAMNLDPKEISKLFESGHAFVRPDRILSDLEPSVAVHAPPGAVHSIASHVAHMAWWQRQLLQDVRGQSTKRQRIEGDEFPLVIALEDWPGVLQDFLSGLEELKALTNDADSLEGSYLGRPVSVGTVLLDFAIHNAYHLGQVVLLRCLQGAWPPRGVDTW
jgi:hypothetical protein